MSFEKITEQDSNYRDIDKMSSINILKNINKEDQTVAISVEKEINSINALVKVIAEKLKLGGRLFYIGAGTSGRLGIVDASECPPTFGVDHGLVIGLMAGGDKAMRNAVEFAEDDTEQAFKDLKEHNITSEDIVIGIAASGTTPYVLGGLKKCKSENIITGCITCNPQSPISENCDYPISINVGAEFITGSTRMKSGTAQKLVLNMISTTVMVLLGKVEGNKMVNMQLSNNKLVDRGTKMVMEKLNLNYQQANDLLNKYGSVKNAIDNYE